MYFEKRIIDPILNTIKENQEYLTQKENLPQLAKLGYMYNTLWYAARGASYDGLIEREEVVEDDGEVWYVDQCDENPKYKIEMCEPINDEIEDYIYDAWSLHVSNELGPSFEEFTQIITKGKDLSEFEIKLAKPNKTFDDWVDILTSPDYEYSSMFPDRRSVADHLLCVIGNGYGFKNGYVIEKAGGADQDSTDYGDWQNAEFREDIQEVVDKIMADSEVEIVLRHREKEVAEHKAAQLEREMKAFGMSYEDFLKSDKYKKFSGSDNQIEKPYEYYPISKNYSIITKINKNSHPSYIQAGIEICEDILANPPKYREDYNEYQRKQCDYQVNFAESFLDKFKQVVTN